MLRIDRIKRLISIFLLLNLTFLFSACVKTKVEQPDGTFQYDSFRDIPGVTEDEIKAVESLQRKGVPLIYGTPLSTEAFINEKGELDGFVVLFCGWLQEFFGIPFQAEVYELTDILEKMKSGGVSFGALTTSENRQRTYSMTTPIVHRSAKVLRIAGKPFPDEIALSRPVRYLFMEGSTLIDSVTAVLKPGSYIAILERDHKTIYEMLKSGEADAYIGNNTVELAFDHYGDVITENFLPLTTTPVSMAAEDPALRPVISVMTKALESGAYNHLTELYRRGYNDYKKNKFLSELSDEERTYVSNTPEIPFVTQFMFYPVSFYSKNEKKWDGIIFDVLDEIVNLTGFKFKLLNDEKTDFSEVLGLLENGTAYCMPNLIQSNERKDRYIWADTMYISDKFALLSKRSFPNIELNDIPFARIGFDGASVFGDLFRSLFPNTLHPREYPSTDAAFMALERGEIDLVLSTQSRLTALTNYYELSDYKANYIFSAEIDSSFAFNKNQTVLCSIIDKALPLIDTERIVDQWLSRTYNIETMRLRGQRPWLAGSLVLIFCVLILLAVLFYRSLLAGRRLEKLVKERTHELTLQSDKLQAVFDSLPDIVFCKDLDLRYTQCNKISEGYTGIKESDVAGKNDIENSIFPYDIARQIMEADRAALKKRVKMVTEETVPFADGIMRTLETIRSPLVQDGVITGLIVIARDITDRKNVEKELELQTAILSTLFDSIPDFIFTKDVHSCYIQCNKSYLAHLGFNREDVIGKNDVDGFKLDPKIVEEYWVWDRKVLNEGRKILIEERIPGADGSNPLFETIKAPLVMDGRIIGLLGISREITKRKEMEETALAASRSKSVFLANMSHEIRTPMNSIMGFSELALDSVVSPKTKEYLEKIQTNAEWLLQIINDILDISKIESGKMELEKIPFDMHELLESCRMLILPKAVEKGISMQFYAEPSVGKRPLGDPTRLRQIIVNLLSNAVKFTNTGTVKVLTEIKEKVEKTVRYHFEIKDSGIGMTGDQIKKIFEPFIQAEIGTTRKYGGTGLGLTICKNFIELMGGKLTVESTPGIGSKFSFDLVFDTVDISSHERAERKAILKEIEKPIFEGEILLCEDNVMNQQVICEHLARVGLNTVIAENGKIGVQKVKDRIKDGLKQFDLIFMDIHMPVMDGVEAAVKIIELGTGIPIVAMTANIMASDLEIYKTSGMRDCIGKPFTSQELWRCLLKYLKPVSKESKDINALRKKTQTEEEIKFQKELKLLFLKSNRNKFEEMEKAINDGDIRLANRLAHNLKTNAGQIGKYSLQQIAGEVENMLKDGKDLPTAEQMKKLETELKNALDEFEPLLEEAAREEERSASVIESEKVKGLLDKLEALLKRGNPESLNYINDLRTVAGSETLIRQMEDFDFEPAVATLAEFRKKLEL